MKLTHLAILVLAPFVLGAAVYGAAANIGVTAPNVGAGEDLVVGCDDSVSVSYTVAWDAVVSFVGDDINRYEVTHVTVSDVAQPDCENDEFRLRLTAADGSTLGTEKFFAGINGAEVLGPMSFVSDDIAAADVADVHILLRDP